MSMPAENMNPALTLDKLFEGIADAPELAVTGLSDDSRTIRPGELFIACQGATSHGLDYLEQVIAANAAAIAWDSSTGSAVDSDLPMIAVTDLQHHVGEIANRWFDYPSRAVHVTGVTGTNGKTTVAWLIRQCQMSLGRKCGYIGTLGQGLEEIAADGSMTTPACIELHRTLADFRDHGAGHAAIEVSSHALEQSRVDGVEFDSAIFTNLSRDHIDYHGSMQAYFETKASLFLDFDIRNRIVSLDCDYGTELANRCGPNVVTVSTRFDRVTNGRPYVFVRGVVHNPGGSQVSITSSWGDAVIDLPLPGDFNVANAAEVLALLLCEDVPLDEACRALAGVTAPPGRMELVAPARAGEPAVYVDYSHTPASLEAALKALGAHCHGKLWCVFGCGGDRDRGKRAMMGKVAARLADFPVVTSDNPRSEDPQRIVADILEGMSDDTVAIVDRAEAIALAVSRAGPEDMILIAGKGHENYQVIGSERLDFSDCEVARDCLAARGGTEGQ
jgi:UDP-N-acetylmuramoyl-L-alanyl-D-glutamate--2,6-diaminopimelate ligase